ncbi:MAG: YopX family protein [Sphaerochaetaceae bacterium]
MRETLFRGKHENGNWLFGSLLIFFDKYYIIPNKDRELGKSASYKLLINYLPDYQVVPETVGQFTGEKCFITGSDLYEGDIMELNLELHVIEFSYRAFVCRSLKKPNVVRALGLFTQVTSVSMPGAKVGNIHDNPELLEERNK